ncbi:MAG: class I SAM-dependent methyltransferase [Clostridiales bacterium]|nr:class I SAM-dependent methyltransferase [Clostridiales bacterium]
MISENNIANKIRMSDRLLVLADMVTPGNRLADVGCDHGYIPIYLCRTEKIPSAIAMDINEGPLERAVQHIEECGLSDRIQTRLSDGLEKLGGDEADTVLIAGMGGCLMCRILIAGDERLGDTATQIHAAENGYPEKGTEQNVTEKNGIPASVTELVLQPQSDIAAVRRCIREIGFCIVDEDMVEEDGKFYPMMKAEKLSDDGEKNLFADWKNKSMIDFAGVHPGVRAEEIADAFGPVLLGKRHPVLKRWLEKELLTTNRILRQLEDAQPAPGDTGNSPADASSPARDRENKLTERFRELLHKKELITAALSYYESNPQVLSYGKNIYNTVGAGKGGL